MNTLFGIILLIPAAAMMLLGAGGLLILFSSAISSGIEQQHIPREIFKLGFYSLFFLFGLKLARFGGKKLT
jgi:hypothetical protein